MVVQRELRGAGLGKAFLQYLLNDPRFRNIKGILLTQDAQGFYEQFGFVRSGERCMLREWDKSPGPIIDRVSRSKLIFQTSGE